MLLQSGVVRLITEQIDSSFAHLLFSLCIFHAVISERKKYGSLGWNVPYVFSMADLEVRYLKHTTKEAFVVNLFSL